MHHNMLRRIVIKKCSVLHELLTLENILTVFHGLNTKNDYLKRCQYLALYLEMVSRNFELQNSVRRVATLCSSSRKLILESCRFFEI